MERLPLGGLFAFRARQSSLPLKKEGGAYKVPQLELVYNEFLTGHRICNAS